MITYNLSAVCDGCNATFSTDTNQIDVDLSELISAAYVVGWRFYGGFQNLKAFCPECVTRQEAGRRTSEASPYEPRSPASIGQSVRATCCSSLGPRSDGSQSTVGGPRSS